MSAMSVADGRPLRAGVVTPLSGALARFGRDGADALTLWARRAATLPAGWAGVELAVVDAAGRPAEAMRELVADGVDVVFGPYGSGPARRACAATDRLVFNHGGATAALRRPDYPRVVNVPAPAATYLHGAVDVVCANEPGTASLTVVHTTTGFAAEVAHGVADHARTRGLTPTMTACRPGSVTSVAHDVPRAEMLAMAGRFDDEQAALQRLRNRGWTAAAFVGAGVDEVFAELPRYREGVLGPAQWTPDTAPTPDEGPDAAWFTAAFTAHTGRSPSYPAAQAFAAGVIAARCLRDAGTSDDDAMDRAAQRLRCTTLYGPFALHPTTGLQTAHHVVTVQWQHGQRRVVWPPQQASAPLRYPLPPAR